MSVLKDFLAGDLGPLGIASIDGAVGGRVRAEQIGTIKRYLPWMMLANASNALVLVAAVWNSPAINLAIPWSSGILAFSVYFAIRSMRAGNAAPKHASVGTVRRAARNAFLLGGLWGVMPLLFFSEASNGAQVVIGCLCAGMLCGGAFAFASIPLAAVAFIVPVSLGSFIAIGRAGEPVYWLVVLLIVAYAAVLIRGVFVHATQMSARLIEQARVEWQVRKDALTNLPNRVSFHERMKHALSRLERYDEGFAVLYIDLNDFKSVNDRWGHAVGDELLMQVARRLQSCARGADMVARLSGDEFAIIAVGSCNANDVAHLADRIIRALDPPFHIAHAEITNSASIGIALAPRDGTEADVLLKHADTALYCAKRGNGGSVQFFDIRQNADTKERRTLEYELRGALQREELFLLYQPILDLENNRVAGFEALLRWNHPRRGILGPMEFIRLAEETGLIHSIGEWVIREACRAASDWPKEIKIAVNVSAVQFRRSELLRAFVSAMAEFGIQPFQLEAEITESVLISDDDAALSIAGSLNELGISLALDDFGVGFSSLTYLRKLPLRKIKIDRSFVHDLLVRPDSASIVKFIIGLAAELGISVTAEGVETPEQLAHLRAARCNEVQGYIVGRPSPAAQARALLDRQARGLVKVA